MRAPYASDPVLSRGRPIAEPACPMRTPFQRDRDRIVHATAFRRLTYKTQVFVFHEGDHFRTRLTHTLEVAQIARAIARLLVLDEDLAEALALAHDLGHPPFGHAGERALDAAMAAHGGFDHNAQSLAIVTRLERKYAAFDGLNLSLETLDGLVKHNGPVAGGGREQHNRRLIAEVAAANLDKCLALDLYACAEAQAAAIADDIAYNNHDLDDALRAGLIALDDLAGVPLVGRYVREALALAPRDRSRVIYEVNRRLITAMIADVADATRGRLARLAPASADDIRRAGETVVAFSDGMAAEVAGLKRYLFAGVYRHPRVIAVMADAEAIVGDLFQRYMDRPDDLPKPWRLLAAAAAPASRAELVTDFVAGMTDRFAIAEHGRLFDATPELR